MTVPEWMILVKAYSMAYGVDPNLSLALAEAEGSGKGSRFRFGRHGRYWLPFGLYVGCKVPRADTPGGNAEGGIKALAGHLRRQGNLRAALRKYNTGDSPAQFERYYQRIKHLERQNRMTGVFE
jgi:soluble lytic murein transglycosylase-like protein